MSETLTTPTAFCRPGEGAACCAFLMLNTEPTGHDLVCAKGTNMEEFLRMRRETKKLKAQGDNCSGPPNFIPPASAAGRERETEDRITISRAVLYAAFRGVMEARRVLETRDSPLGPSADDARRALCVAWGAFDWTRIERSYGLRPTFADDARASFAVWVREHAEDILRAELDHLRLAPERGAEEETNDALLDELEQRLREPCAPDDRMRARAIVRELKHA